MSNRSIYYTAIKQWGELLQHSDQVDFVNLQYDNCEAELSDAEKEFNLNITNFSDIDLFNDFESICALISSLDLVIAPCTVMSDLAGALGVKTLYLVNSPEGNWRFRHGTNQDIWFSDIEFIKPDAFGDTDSLMKNLASSFNDRLKEILK